MTYEVGFGAFVGVIAFGVGSDRKSFKFIKIGRLKLVKAIHHKTDIFLLFVHVDNVKRVRHTRVQCDRMWNKTIFGI